MRINVIIRVHSPDCIIILMLILALSALTHFTSKSLMLSPKTYAVLFVDSVLQKIE